MCVAFVASYSERFCLLAVVVDWSCQACFTALLSCRRMHEHLPEGPQNLNGQERNMGVILYFLFHSSNNINLSLHIYKQRLLHIYFLHPNYRLSQTLLCTQISVPSGYSCTCKTQTIPKYIQFNLYTIPFQKKICKQHISINIFDVQYMLLTKEIEEKK